MSKYLAILFVIIYCNNVVHHFFKLNNLFSILDVLEKYLKSVTSDGLNRFIPLDNHFECLQELLFIYPKIQQHLGFYTPDLEYGFSNEKNYSNAVEIYNELLMKKNYYILHFKQSFNPLIAFKKLLRIPSTLINWLGFSPKNTAIKFINLIGWVATYFLNLYSEEIKLLISSFFQN